MKWKHNKSGDKKIVRKFLYLPLAYKDHTYWLQHIYIEYTFGGGGVYDEDEWEITGVMEEL